MRTARWALLCLATAACGGDPLLPPADALQGRWGGVGIEVATTPFFATIGAPCIGWMIPRAIRVAPDGSFQGIARRPGVSLTMTEVWYSGRLDGDRMFLSLRGEYVGDFELRRGVSGEFAQFACALAP